MSHSHRSLGLSVSAGPSVSKKTSTGQSLARADLQNDKFWRKIQHLEPKEEKTLESSWDARHHRNYQLINDMINPGFRDYFDRKRELEGEYVGVRPKVRWLSTWSLAHSSSDGRGAADGTADDDDDVEPPPRRPVRICASESELLARRAGGWDNRHHVTHSAGNHRLYENNREYFGRFVNQRSQRVLPQRVHGITKHQMPHRMPGQPEGVDDEPSPAERFVADLQHAPPRGRGEQGHHARQLSSSSTPCLPRLAGAATGGGSSGGFAERPAVIPGRPDGTFDGWGD